METREQYQKRIAAWAQREYRSAAFVMAARREKSARGKLSVFDNPKATLAEIAAASSWRGDKV